MSRGYFGKKKTAPDSKLLILKAIAASSCKPLVYSDLWIFSVYIRGCPLLILHKLYTPFDRYPRVMQGETRKVVSLVPKGRGGTMGAKQRATVPPDPSFFFGSRVKLSGGRLRDPYREHAYFHAAVKRVSAAISSAPFRIFRDSQSKDGVTSTSTASRKAAFAELRGKHPELPEGLFNIYNGRDEATRRRLVRDMYSDIRGFAPSADIDTMMRAIGVEIVDSGPWAELFRDVNPEMTRSQLWEASTIYMHQGGETFWIPLVRRGNALVKWQPPPKPVPGSGQNKWVPAELWPFGKAGWKPLPDKKKSRIGGWEFKHKPFGLNEEKTDVFSANQIGHYRFFDPLHRGRGLAPTEALAIELAQDHNAARYNEAFFERGAQLPWVMVFENGLSETQREDVEEQMLRDYSGLDNMWRPAVFEGNAKIEKIGMSQRDMDYHTLRQWVRDEVLAVIGTPKSELGIFQDANRASALVSKRVFWENTNLPLMRYYEDNTDSWLFSPVSGGTVFGAFDTSQIEALRDDLLSKVQVSEKLFKLGFTANEINERLNLGFDQHPARELVWLNQNLKAHDKNTTVDTANPVAPVEDGNGGGDNGAVPGGGENSEATDQVSLFDAAEGEPVKAGKIVVPEYKGSVEATVRVFNEADTEALALVGVQAARVQRVLDTVRKRLVVALSLGIKNKLGRKALLAVVRAKLAFLSSLSNISPAVRTEIAQITSLARNLEMRRRGVATNVWITSRDNRVRTPEHVVLDAKVGDVGFNFASLIPGHGSETLQFPLDPRASARLVINCRCVLVPDRAEVTRTWDDDEKDRVWERIMGRVLDPNERRFEKMISSILWRVRGAQLKRIEQAPLDPDGEFLQTPEQLAVPVKEFKKALTELSTPIYKQTWSDAVDEIGDELEEIGILIPSQF